MSLVNIDTVRKQVQQQLDRLTPPAGVEILSYKRNRGVALLLQDTDTVRILERGYLDQELTVDRARLAKNLKPILKREFPRSRKLRIYQLTGPEELDQPRKKL